MKTEMKSDALLDAFDKMELTQNEMDIITGGGNVGFDYTTPSGTVTHVYDGDTGAFVGYWLNGSQETAQYLMAENDHYVR